MSTGANSRCFGVYRHLSGMGWSSLPPGSWSRPDGASLEGLLHLAEARGVDTGHCHQESRKHNPGNDDSNDDDSHGFLLRSDPIHVPGLDLARNQTV